MAASIKSLRASSAGPFQVLTLIVVLIVIGLGAFLAGTYLQVFDDGSGEPWTTDANSFSRSAIGHRAFVATLRQLGIPVEVSRFRTLDRVGDNNLLLLLEPDDEFGWRSRDSDPRDRDRACTCSWSCRNGGAIPIRASRVGSAIMAAAPGSTRYRRSSAKRQTDGTKSSARTGRSPTILEVRWKTRHQGSAVLQCRGARFPFSRS